MAGRSWPVERAVGWRHGLVPLVDAVPRTMADLPVEHVGAHLEPTPGGTPLGGGVAHDADTARRAAVAEALERYAALACPLETEDRLEDPPGTGRTPEVVPLERFTLHSPTQRRAVGFPYARSYQPGPLTGAFSLSDNRPVRVPLCLVTLDPRRTTLATSSGLAADPSPWRALLRGLQELVERDALMVTWLHGVAPPRVALPERLADPVRRRGGDATCFDLTPAYSPHPVAAVAGNLPERGRPRLSLGVACRARWAEAVEKAWLEWAQGVTFAGSVRRLDPGLRLTPPEVTDFDRHAVFYTLDPGRWAQLPLWRGPHRPPPADAPGEGEPAIELRQLVEALDGAGVATYYRELTTVDVARVGLRVVRVLAPALVPIHPDHNWPHLGGTTADLGFRYPGVAPGPFPNPAPHPLG